MPELPRISEDFTADASGYIAAIQAMIDKTQTMIDKVSELKDLIDGLDGKDIQINIAGDANAMLDEIATKIEGLENRTIVINAVYRQTGSSDVAPIIQPVINRVVGSTGGAAGNIANEFQKVITTDTGTAAAASAETVLAAAVAKANDALNNQKITGAQAALIAARMAKATEAAAKANLDNASAASKAAYAAQVAANMNKEKASAEFDATAATLASIDATLTLANTDKILADYEQVIKGNTDASSASLLNMALAAKAMGQSIGQSLVPLGLASFGIMGIGTAIHLVVMGIFEFLAVFIPAMYAAAAGAAVMMQGVQLVSHEVKGLYTATEALGPMFNTTAGDMVGLGHSLQTAQNAANPAVYTLFGEALLGVKAATDMVSPSMSSFGTLGLNVAHMLDQFGAKLVLDIQDNMPTIRQLVGAAAADLRTFGQILGNVGHALFNFAAAMPGLAVILLHIVNGITELIKWVSSLPAPLITVIMVIEEMYRWSGILVGVFGILGRAIALVGTLGIPVFLKIGANIGAMAANVLLGVKGMITNFVALGTTIGLFGPKVDAMASGVVGKLETVITKLQGPWGIAFGIAAVAVGVLIIAMMHVKTATQQWIDTSQKAVQAASNMQVLGVIAQQYAATNQKLAEATQHYNQVVSQNPEKINAAKAAQDNLNQTQNTGVDRAKAAQQAMLNEQYAAMNGAQAYTSYRVSVAQAQAPIQQLTAYQQQLIGQNLNVVSGAALISKTYGVDFVTALGMATAAGVDLSKGITGQSKAAQQARIQIDALYLSYKQMDQTGTTLANTMNAVNIQAGLQASKVSQVNQAWDQFIQMSTSLTGSYTQLNLDLQQMGNVAQTTGGKIRAFTTNAATGVQLSVTQIAQALTSFSGSSAQVWQSFNQSVQQANTFMDSLRVAAAAGTVSQKQYGDAAKYVVAQLVPYASQSKAALAEVMAIAQESEGPAYNASRGLAENYKTLVNWTDQNKNSSKNFNSELTNLTIGISNVTTVARNFAGTLQSDVLNAVAAAGADTTKITQLTEAYTQSLRVNGAQSPITAAAQKALTNALAQYGIKGQDVTQVENILSNAYDRNRATLTAGQAARVQLQNDIGKLLATVPSAQSDIVKLTQAVQRHGATAQSYAGARQQLINDLIRAGVNAKTAASDVDGLIGALKRVPANVNANVRVTGSGGEHIVSSVGPGGNVTVYPVRAAAQGGVIPGYEPGHDSVLTMLSKGEGVLIPQAVRMLGGEKGIHAINQKAQHFAWGGVIGLPNRLDFTAADDFGAANAAVLAQVLGSINAQVTAKLAAQAAAALAASAGGAALGGNVTAWVQAAMKATGAPASWLSYLLRLVSLESGGNPSAVDPISVMGEHATGLFQTLPSTFAQFATVGGGILNPVANAVAGIRYIQARYGSPANIPGLMSGHYVGYDQGGYLMPGLTLAYNGTGHPERVSPAGGESQIIHNIINLDGQKIWENQQKYTFRYNSRNAGNANINGSWAPR